MNTQPTQKTDGQEAIEPFELWQDMLIAGLAPDCKRYEKEFFEFYGDRVASPQAPFYLMFCAFVGALDLAEAAGKEKDLDQEDTETAK
jgi:hypothetical protein